MIFDFGPSWKFGVMLRKHRTSLSEQTGESMGTLLGETPSLQSPIMEGRASPPVWMHQS